ncbi:unnamed protein product [Thlaspi arvense]|uniref:Chaoptin n=1 Tax=Thlaspi arvense TaxID=13288 RepID=A0AAU9SGI6_THLAR|nr:unnamed protein product [Thlaspi arvense]
MDGPFSFKELKNLTNLELLDLSQNNFNGSMAELIHLQNLKALDLKLKNLTNLEVLGLAGSRFRGPIPMKVVCEIKNLRELDLSSNHFTGQISLCLGSLNKLRVLDLSFNQFSGNLPSSFSNLESLEYLSLTNNNFTGLLSLNPLANLTKLKIFKLSSTSNMVQVETESTWQPKFQLTVVVLQFCSLEKTPFFLVYQKNLRLVDLSGNRLSGNIPTWLLVNNPDLEVLQLQTNSFTIFQLPNRVHNLQVLDVSANDIGELFPDNIGRVLPNLVHINCSNNGFQGYFPSSMGEMKNLTFLDMSYNNFSGKLHRSFFTGCFSVQYLKLSHNKFSGHFLPRGTNFTLLRVLRMDNNLFTGNIRVDLLRSSTLSILDISNNSLTGAIPSWISKLSRLAFLLLSNNMLEGTMPPSLLLMPSLWYLEISGNLLSGGLPSHVNGMRGRHLFLQNNNFTGPIPNTFLESVQVLDLRNNKLSGSIPQFFDTVDIHIILLRGNNFTGSIPRQLCDLRNVRILDLSYNKLNGFIPACLYNLSFGPGEYENKDIYSPPAFALITLQLGFYKSTFVKEEFIAYYFTFQEIEIKFTAKRRYDSYTGRSAYGSGILDYMYGMDLSNNELSGVIPTELGHLSKLRALNLSHNFLSSSIPSNFSNLKDIESLDLSYNMLHGSIPQELISLQRE